MISDVKLTSLSKTAGCAAKIGPKTLASILGKLPKFENENLLVGIDTNDDGAVYRINDDVAIISTLDFFTPVVDDPFIFGQIAACNALSDIYAMGGEPILALNIVAFSNCLDPEILGEILKGGALKVKEAGAVLAGGHSIQDDEPKYGLSVNGIVHPDKIFTNSTAKAGDKLILTKPVGVGIVNTAIKADMAKESSVKEAIYSMTSLNKRAKDVFLKHNINACTDVTGFGVLGHGLEMAKGSDVSIRIHPDKISYITGAMDLADMGIVPEGAYRNREFVTEDVDLGGTKEVYIDLLCDPQTSGGLLASVPGDNVESVHSELKNAGVETEISIIGEVEEKGDKFIYVA